MAFPYLGLSFPNMGTKMRSRKWVRLTIVPPTDIPDCHSVVGLVSRQVQALPTPQAPAHTAQPLKHPPADDL